MAKRTRGSPDYSCSLYAHKFDVFGKKGSYSYSQSSWVSDPYKNQKDYSCTVSSYIFCGQGEPSG
jgi:hypothetical protein